MKPVIAGLILLFLLATASTAQEPSASLNSGAYKVDTWFGSSHHAGTLRLTVTGNQLSGQSEWSCCPRPRVDALTGQVSGNTVRWLRNCTGQGNPDAKCEQVYDGTIKGNLVEGTVTHNGARAGTWKMALSSSDPPPPPVRPAIPSGAYKVDTWFGSSHHAGTLRLTVTGNQLSGQSEWSCCPRPRVDALTGEVSGNTVRWLRNCTGQGNPDAKCEQVYEGTIKGNLVEGTVTHNGARAGTWKMALPPPDR